MGLPSGWTANANSHGIITGLAKTNAGASPSVYKVYLPSGSSQYTLIDSNGTSLTPSDVGLNNSDIQDTQTELNKNINYSTASPEAVLYGQYKNFYGSDESLVRARMDAENISRSQAISELQSELGRPLYNLQPDGKTVQNAPSQKAKYSKSSTSASTADYKVKLISKINPSDSIIFVVSPNIDESRSASYDAINPVHHPGVIQVYKTTSSRNFNVNGKLISRTRNEATRNLKYINIIRSWVMPYYGTGTGNNPETKKRLGAPPDLLTFSAYGKMNLESIPVVLAAYNWTYSDTVDYIPTNSNIPFPAVLDISLTLLEAYSPEQFSKFDLYKYKTGDLPGSFN